MPLLLGCVALALMSWSCFWAGPKRVGYSFADCQSLDTVDDAAGVPCRDFAYAEIRRIGLDTSLLRLTVLEDDSVYLFSFVPTAKSALQPNGDFVVPLRRGAEMFYSKVDCKRLQTFITQ